jgi:RNA ligase
MSIDFEPFQKIPRLKRDCVITEKLDGTNAQICITEDGDFCVGSRNRWISPDDDNYGFAKWAYGNQHELMNLGPGRHFGEWWGLGIQRSYGMSEKAFSLFNVGRWEGVDLPCGIRTVPVLYRGEFSSSAAHDAVEFLRANGSLAAPGFMRPEGIIVYQTAARQLFKVTLEKDSEPKGKAGEAV